MKVKLTPSSDHAENRSALQRRGYKCLTFVQPLTRMRKRLPLSFFRFSPILSKQWLNSCTGDLGRAAIKNTRLSFMREIKVKTHTQLYLHSYPDALKFCRCWSFGQNVCNRYMSIKRFLWRISKVQKQIKKDSLQIFYYCDGIIRECFCCRVLFCFAVVCCWFGFFFWWWEILPILKSR